MADDFPPLNGPRTSHEFFDRDKRIRELEAQVAELQSRPTPSSALTKALEVLKERQSHYHIVKDSGEDVSECLRCMAEKALRASPGGEGEIERHGDCSARIERAQKLQMEIDAGYWKKEVEQARMEGFKYGCEMSGTWPESEKDQQDVCFVAKTQMSAAIVASHKSPAPEKDGRHE